MCPLKKEKSCFKLFRKSRWRRMGLNQGCVHTFSLHYISLRTCELLKFFIGSNSGDVCTFRPTRLLDASPMIRDWKVFWIMQTLLRALERPISTSIPVLWFPQEPMPQQPSLEWPQDVPLSRGEGTQRTNRLT